MEYLISQFADDTSIYLDGRRELFENVIKILHEFALWSGLKINYDKSQVVWLGSQKGSGTLFLPHSMLTWNPKTFKVLGITFSLDLKKWLSLIIIQSCNKYKIFKELERQVPHSTGQICLIKSLMMSTITHLFLSPKPMRTVYYRSYAVVLWLHLEW